MGRTDLGYVGYRWQGSLIKGKFNNDMLIFLDSETTGAGPADCLCQIAFKTEEGAAVNELFNPGMPITIDAMTVYHITNEMVLGKPSFRGSDTWKQLQDLMSSDTNIMVAHSAAFDVDMLEKEGIEPKSVICTFKLARYFDKERDGNDSCDKQPHHKIVDYSSPLFY